MTPRPARSERSPGPAAMAPGGDRASLRLSAADEALIAAAAAANANLVVVVMAGSAVVMPWAESVRALMMLWYPGMEGGAALADVLFGVEAPSGRLPFAVPSTESDLVPFDRDAAAAEYGLLHGQWWLDATDRAAAYPFGFGLSYGTTEIDRATVAGGTAGGAALAVEVELTAAAGPFTVDELVLVLGRVVGSAYERPPRRVVGFARARVAPGTTARVSVPVELSCLDVRVDGRWVREAARYEFDVVRHCGERGVTVVIGAGSGDGAD